MITISTRGMVTNTATRKATSMDTDINMDTNTVTSIKDTSMVKKKLLILNEGLRKRPKIYF